MRRPPLVTGSAVLVLLLAALGPLTTARASALIGAASPCGVPGVTNYHHVVWIVLENQNFSLGASSPAPYLSRLSSACGLATNDHAVAHPSLPNYLALTSGSTQGVTDDGEPSVHPVAAPSLFSQLGTGWRALVESMPTACDRVTSGNYAARHNPAVYYRRLQSTCARQDVALSGPLDLGARFTFITPNVCNDMHSCPVSVGDTWLRQMIPRIIASRQYQQRSLVLFVTFDESDVSATNQVTTVVVAPSVPRGLRVGVPFTHYSLLRTTESLLRVGHLGAARAARSMIGPFHL